MLITAALDCDNAVVLPTVCVQPVAKSPVQFVDVQPVASKNSAEKTGWSVATVGVITMLPVADSCPAVFPSNVAVLLRNSLSV